MKQANHFIAVEANIAVGKSTLRSKLAEALDWNSIQKPVNDPGFTRFLEASTRNPNDPACRINLQQYITKRRQALLRTCLQTKTI